MTTAQPANAASSDPAASDSRTFVIVGAGLAGARAALALREQGFLGTVVLLGDEVERPYQRPPLSKRYLNGSSERDTVFVFPQEWYGEHNIDLRTWTEVTAIDSKAHHVVFADGTTLAYDKLLLTTGSRARPFPDLAADTENVHYIRHLSDCEDLMQVLATGSSLLVVGAGWIGLEVAATARNAGLAVTVVESAELPLLRVLGPECAQVFADVHRERGVDLRLGTEIAEVIVTDGRAGGVRLADGTEIRADAVVIGIGAVPNTEIAEAAGLEVDNGVLVDASLQTSHPDIYAAGDIASAWHPLLGKRIRVEHWANAQNQPATAVGAMLGRDASYTDLPYFYTTQYDLAMKYTGHVEPDGYDQVVFRGDVAGREFIAFYVSGGRVLAAMYVNGEDVTEQVKALILSGEAVDLARLADPGVPLGELVQA